MQTAPSRALQVARVTRYAGRMLLSRLRRSPVLMLANLYPTHHCNLRCTYCNSPFKRTPELTTAQWLRVIDELADLGCRRVLILGGEPLLRRDIADLIARVKMRRMSCVLTSNGLLVAKRIQELRELDTLVLSLDAAGPANDLVRGDGVFAAVQAALLAAQAIGLPVKINAVLSAVTAPQLNELLDFVARHDLHITINAMRSGAPDLWRDAATIKAADGEVARMLERLATLSRSNRRMLFAPATYRYAARWGDYGRDRLQNGEVAAGDARVRSGPRCQAGRYYLSINPDGTTYPCTITVDRLPGGNVVTDGVAAAWRKLHHHPCVACYAPCLVEQNYLFSLHPPTLLNFAAKHLGRYA